MNGFNAGKPALRVEIISELSGLNALEPAWQRLWTQDQDSDIFASLDWFLTWWEHFGHGEQAAALVTHDGLESIAVPGGGWQLRVCVVRDERNEALAIVPLVLIRGVFKRLRCRILASPVNNHAPRMGLVASRFGEDVVSALCDALIGLEAWDVLLLDGLPSKGGRSGRLVSALAERGLVRGPHSAWPHSFFRFRGTWDELLASKGRKFRKHVGQNQRALEKLGEVRVQRFLGDDVANRGLDLFLAIDQASWKAREGESVGLNDALRRYYGDLCHRFAARGCAEIWVLQVGGEAAAAYLCLCGKQLRYTLKTSFRAVFGDSNRTSPSNVLLDSIIRQSWELGTKGVDFVGKVPFVERWANEDHIYEQAVFYRNGLWALRMRTREQLERQASRIRALVARVRG